MKQSKMKKRLARKCGQPKPVGLRPAGAVLSKFKTDLERRLAEIDAELSREIRQFGRRAAPKHVRKEEGR